MGQMYTGTRKDVKQDGTAKSEHGIQGEGEGSGGEWRGGRYQASHACGL